jgi:hypothetical protein
MQLTEVRKLKTFVIILRDNSGKYKYFHAHLAQILHLTNINIHLVNPQKSQNSKK